MKKLFTALMFSLAAINLSAQDSPGSLKITSESMYLSGTEITVEGVFEEETPGTTEISTHRWTIYPSDPDGNLRSDAVITQDVDGAPSGAFTIPGTADLPEGNYQLQLSATSYAGDMINSPFSPFSVNSYTLQAQQFNICGQGVPAVVYASFQQAQAAFSYNFQIQQWDIVNNTVIGPQYSSQPIASNSFTFPPQWTPQCESWYLVTCLFIQNNFVVAAPSQLVYVGKINLKTKSSFCCGQYINGQAQYWPQPGDPQAATYNWEIVQCNSSWQAQSVVHTSSSTNVSAISGGYETGNDFFQAWTFAPCSNPAGHYLLMVVYFYDSSNNMIATTSKQIYISPLPQPVITATNAGPFCGTNTYCVNNLSGPGYTYSWGLNNSYNVYQSGISNCVTRTNDPHGAVTVTATNQYGCSNIIPVTIYVTNLMQRASFSAYVAPHSTVPGKFQISVIRDGNYYQNGQVDDFVVEPVSPNFPYPNTSGFTYSNGTWGDEFTNGYTLGHTQFQSYNGINNGYSGITPAYNPYGIFDPGTKYRITRNLNYTGGCLSTYSMVVDQNGVVCSNCRMGNGDEEAEVSAPATIEGNDEMNIVPNPNNGEFTIALGRTAEHAQVEILNILGEKIDQFSMNGTHAVYSAHDKLPKGLYLLRITENGKAKTQRFVVD